MTDFLPVTLTPSLARQQYSRELKRQIVEQSLAPGISIASVARAHGVNANLLHKWRVRYRHGELGAVAAVTAPSTLTAVQIVKPARLAVAKPSQPTTIRTETAPPGYIELLFSNARVLVHGAPDRQTLRNVIDALRL
jgi:transposase